MSKKKDADFPVIEVNEQTTLASFRKAVKDTEGPYLVKFVKPYPAEVNLLAKECVKLGCQVREEA